MDEICSPREPSAISAPQLTLEFEEGTYIDLAFYVASGEVEVSLEGVVGAKPEPIFDGERTLNDQGISVRCLQRPDGSLPSGPDDDGDLVAYVARAY